MQTKYLLSEVNNRMEEAVVEDARDSKRRRVEQQQQQAHHYSPVMSIPPELNLPVNDSISYMILPPFSSNDLYNVDYRPQMIPIFPFYMPLHPVPYQPLDSPERNFESGIDLLASISSYNYLLEQTKVASC